MPITRSNRQQAKSSTCDFIFAQWKKHPMIFFGTEWRGWSRTREYQRGVKRTFVMCLAPVARTRRFNFFFCLTSGTVFSQTDNRPLGFATTPAAAITAADVDGTNALPSAVLPPPWQLPQPTRSVKNWQQQRFERHRCAAQ